MFDIPDGGGVALKKSGRVYSCNGLAEKKSESDGNQEEKVFGVPNTSTS